MAAEDRSGKDPLTHIARLEDKPETFHILHALRVIEAAHPDAPRIGEARRPREDPVRYGQEAELQFPPSTIADYTPAQGDAPPRLTNRFFGMFGPHGPLPLHLTEYARDRLRNHRDPTLVSFANMLTHRLMTLFFRAWRSGQPAPSFDRGDRDEFESKVAAIGGFHGAHLRRADAFPDVAKRHFAGLLAQGPKNAEGLQSILQAFFNAPVKVEEFIASWLELEPDDRWQMGQPAVLGRTASIGDRVRSRSSKFRLRIGPLTYDDYQRLLPGGASLARLRAIVRNYAGDALDWDVNLVLRADGVPEAKLGETVRLGQTGWIGSRDTTKDADDLYLEPNVRVLIQGAATTGG
ncbi:type VI secretion system baseplate subunit TssG [Tateyamaria sp. ANG-S1]|uniref:type VI secretion system baseplate subunit TssG n=1 Tax=Tateyamaria sp. ANG-S1 TaxID=1577905 RepID=UPI00057DFAC1|nr:type VI secretion system baseplate subunit TssG [Tateyamaria sp. ANG-S1]KIC47729.1 type VI secretion protein [Tateyamaria sp. ANG-S1]